MPQSQLRGSCSHLLDVDAQLQAEVAEVQLAGPSERQVGRSLHDGASGLSDEPQVLVEPLRRVDDRDGTAVGREHHSMGLGLDLG